MRLLSILAVTAVFFLTYCFVLAKELSIVYSCNTAGKLKACGCPPDPYGGLSERVTLIRQLRRKEKPFLLVDGGNMVNPFGAFDRKAAAVMRIMNLMDYNVAGVSFMEMFQGIKSARAMVKEAAFPMISSTIVEDTSGLLLFESTTTVTVDDVTVGVLCVSDSLSLTRYGSLKISGYRFLPYEPQIKQGLQALKNCCDFIILLSQLNPDQNVAITRSFPAIDLIIEAYGTQKYDPPRTDSGGIIVSPGGRGQFIGLVTISKNPGKKVRVTRHELIPVINIPEDDQAHKVIIEYYDGAEKKN